MDAATLEMQFKIRSGKGKLRKRKQVEAGEMRAYAARDRILERMGYASYEEYLASPTWQTIRRARMLADRGFCYACRERNASQVHHCKYDRKTLQGRTYANLRSLCARCHEIIEFDADGMKLPMALVNIKLECLRCSYAFEAYCKRFPGYTLAVITEPGVRPSDDNSYAAE